MTEEKTNSQEEGQMRKKKWLTVKEEEIGWGWGRDDSVRKMLTIAVRGSGFVSPAPT